MKNEALENKDDNELEIISKEEQAVLEKIAGGNWKKYGRVVMAALGVLPWVGSILSATVTLSSEDDQGETNQLLFLWVKEHGIKLSELSRMLNSVFAQFESFGESLKERIESKEYIGIVRKAFKIWDGAETYEKKEKIRKLLTNAGGNAIVQDNWLHIFLDWIEKYNDLHFAVIAQIYTNPSITRKKIWLNIKGKIPTDSSDEADMFKLLIDDLTIGRVIRQRRETNSLGQFYKKERKPKCHSSDVMDSPFDDEDLYVLTELGTGFVRYVMNELIPKIGNTQ